MRFHGWVILDFWFVPLTSRFNQWSLWLSSARFKLLLMVLLLLSHRKVLLLLQGSLLLSYLIELTTQHFNWSLVLRLHLHRDILLILLIKTCLYEFASGISLLRRFCIVHGKSSCWGLIRWPTRDRTVNVLAREVLVLWQVSVDALRVGDVV